MRKNYFEIILKLFQRFMSHVSTCETKKNYFGRRKTSEIISKLFHRH